MRGAIGAWLALVLVAVPGLAVAGDVQLAGSVQECETAFVDVSFVDRKGQAVTVDWYHAIVDDAASGVRLWDGGQVVAAVSTATIEIPPVGQQTVHEHSTRENHRLIVSFQYDSTRYGVTTYQYTVERVDGIDCNLGPTPAPTKTPTPTFTPTATPTPTPTP